MPDNEITHLIIVGLITVLTFLSGVLGYFMKSLHKRFESHLETGERGFVTGAEHTELEEKFTTFTQDSEDWRREASISLAELKVQRVNDGEKFTHIQGRLDLIDKKVDLLLSRGRR